MKIEVGWKYSSKITAEVVVVRDIAISHDQRDHKYVTYRVRGKHDGKSRLMSFAEFSECFSLLHAFHTRKPKKSWLVRTRLQRKANEDRAEKLAFAA